jgi:MFS family permease
MLKSLKSLIAPITGQVILVMGNSFFITFTSLRLKIEGHSIEVIGYITAAYFAGLLLGSLKLNKFIERVGHIRAYATFASLFAVVTLLQALDGNIFLWLSSRFLIGYFMAGLFITIESWLLASATPEIKGKILSIYMLCYFASQGIAQLLINIAPPSTLLPFIIITLLGTISIVPVCITKIKAPVISEPSYFKISKLLKISPLGFFGAFCAGLITGPNYGLIPIYLKGHGFSLEEISLGMGITILGGLILQWPLGHLSDHIDRRKVIFLTSFAIFIISTIIGINSIYSFLPFFILLFIYGGFSFVLYPLSMTHTSDKVEKKDLISTIAVLSLTYSIGAIVGPIIASYSMNFLGPKGLFFYVAIVGILIGSFSFFNIIKKKSLPQEDKGKYKNIPRTSPIIGNLNNPKK